MGQICQHCRNLLSMKIRSSCHHSISRLNNSELIKCSSCNAFLLYEQNTLELLQPSTDLRPAALNF